MSAVEPVAVTPVSATGKKVGTPLAAIRDFFGMDLKEMKAEWTQGPLADTTKKELMKGVWALYEAYPNPAERQKFLDDPAAKAEGVLVY